MLTNLLSNGGATGLGCAKSNIGDAAFSDKLDKGHITSTSVYVDFQPVTTASTDRTAPARAAIALGARSATRSTASAQATVRRAMTPLTEHAKEVGHSSSGDCSDVHLVVVVVVVSPLLVVGVN